MVDKLLNTTVFDTSGRPYRLVKSVGAGTQGMVYEEDSGQFVVKIARKRDAVQLAEIKRRYTWLLERTLEPATRLVLPEAILAAPHVGYVMRRVKGHQPLGNLLRPAQGQEFRSWYHAETGGLRKRLLVGAALARAFGYLHREGLAYCDLSPDNIMVARDPQSASVCLIDPDNVSVSGEARCLVMGTDWYIAPEILRGTHQPDSVTDNYSLAVILFEILRLGHPLLGDSVAEGTPEDEQAALRGERLYVDHPDDSSNRSSSLLDSDLVFTIQLRQLFERAFVHGLVSRDRPVPSEWEEALFLAADYTAACSDCASTYFPRPLAGQKEKTICPVCGATGFIPPYLKFSQWARVEGVDNNGQPTRRDLSTPLNMLTTRKGDTALMARHAYLGCKGAEGDEVVAVLKPTADDRWLNLANTSSGDIWVQRAGSQHTQRVRPGTVQPISHGFNMWFGEMNEGRVVRSAKLVHYKAASK